MASWLRHAFGLFLFTRADGGHMAFLVSIAPAALVGKGRKGRPNRRTSHLVHLPPSASLGVTEAELVS